MDHVQVQTTAASATDAERISCVLVTERLAAAVQVLGPVRSTYRLRGELASAEEWVCVARTTADRCPALERRLAEMHPSGTPEITVFPITAGSPSYLDWVVSETRI
jgi:periplasmic divalent cation tolerance protein